jgi:hypothetical protein
VVREKGVDVSKSIMGLLVWGLYFKQVGWGWGWIDVTHTSSSGLL